MKIRMKIRSRRDAADFTRRVREFTPGGVIKIRTPSGKLLVILCRNPAAWVRLLFRKDASRDLLFVRQHLVENPARWAYANRRMVNKWLRHVQRGRPPDAVAE